MAVVHFGLFLILSPYLLWFLAAVVGAVCEAPHSQDVTRPALITTLFWLPAMVVYYGYSAGQVLLGWAPRFGPEVLPDILHELQRWTLAALLTGPLIGALAAGSYLWVMRRLRSV